MTRWLGKKEEIERKLGTTLRKTRLRWEFGRRKTQIKKNKKQGSIYRGTKLSVAWQKSSSMILSNKFELMFDRWRHGTCWSDEQTTMMTTPSSTTTTVLPYLEEA